MRRGRPILTPNPATGTPPALLRPVLAVTDRLRTGMRLGMVVLVLLVPGALATGMYATEKASDLAFTGRERQGVVVLGPMLTALADITAGRDPDLAAIRAVVAGHPDLDIGDELAAVPEIGSGGAAARIATATALVTLISAVGDDSNLILDPDLDSFYVMDAQIVQVPQALLAALTAAHPDTTLTTRKAVAAKAVLAGRLEGVADALRRDVVTATKHTDSAGLADRLATVQALADAIITLDQAITETLSSPLAGDPVAVATAATATVAPLTGVLTELLTGRTDEDSRERGLVVGISLGGFLLALWCAAGVLWRTSHDVLQMVDAVTAIAGSDLAPRPLPEGRDEMGDIGRALVVARARLQEQDDALVQAEVAREQQLRAGFLHQRQAETQFRRRTQEIIDESTTVIAEELRQVTDKVSEVRTAAEVIDDRISVTDAATSTIVGQAHDAERVIASLEASLRRDTTAMSETISTMIEGIGGVGHAATSLRTVAADQGELVERLSVQMTDTLGRVDEMTDLASRLERREHDRIAAAGKVALRRAGGTSTPAILINFSAGGLRCIVTGDAPYTEGATADAELTGKTGSTLTVHARVVNVVDSPGQQEIGLQFLVTDDAMGQQLVSFAEQMVG
ncbi:methyl-accepting chemotaxis protein [Actinoplanes awajinensis]|uniref:HAMP domain-containing protein n=1 Tax=Actinoplanes awajinensis subsp. mycoplanecinus TaxID=135947 RepID=A0A101JH10_9ACTN|nr:methyl-accepting chemotaxis protein [Actinoplanes awajinensis]KUL26698.1 hypothetical protein ADL15_37430 [Actinoplanes awajinensis subsp. mycoplanecinus]